MSKFVQLNIIDGYDNFHEVYVDCSRIYNPGYLEQDGRYFLEWKQPGVEGDHHSIIYCVGQSRYYAELKIAELISSMHECIIESAASGQMFRYGGREA